YEQLVATQKTSSFKQPYPHAPTIPAPDVTNNAPSISLRKSTSHASGPTPKRKQSCDDNPPALNSQPTCLNQADSSTKDVPLASLPKQIITITPNSHPSTDAPQNLCHAFPSASQDPPSTNQQESPNHIASLTIDNLDKGTKEDIPLASIPNHPVEPDHNRADFSPLANCPATDFASTVLKAHKNVSSIPRQVKPSTTVSKEDD
ncbi:hypothetical protein MJO29_016478, partial [Puccinia striiformis f. sp. tritici]